MNNIYEIIGNLLAAVFVALAAYLVQRARAWLEANTDKATQDKLEALVTAFARAAEQLFHDVDPSGEKRMQFVKQQLRAMGVEVTNAVINMIESAVWEINTETKKAQALAAQEGGPALSRTESGTRVQDKAFAAYGVEAVSEGDSNG